MNNLLLTGILGWFFPGLGHILEGRIKRGIVIGSTIWIMFIIAIVSGGAYYPGFDFKDGALLYLLNIFSRLGNGLGSIISFYLLASPPPNIAALATFEYGGKFLEAAGLLNYLAVIDALDIHLGRKK